jgi:hypothetical protein
MGLQTARSTVQYEFETYLKRTNPFKVKLIRANPYNCVGGNCFTNGRESIDATCPVCAGTGYLGVELVGTQLTVTATGKPYDDTIAPASFSYYIYGDVQTGHGLYGSGGDFLKLLLDLGKQDVGDGTLFSLMWDHDAITGQIIYPLVDPTLVRPDRIVSVHGTVYNIVRQQVIEIGAVTICRMFTLESGTFTSTGASGR